MTRKEEEKISTRLEHDDDENQKFQEEIQLNLRSQICSFAYDRFTLQSE